MVFVVKLPIVSRYTRDTEVSEINSRFINKGRGMKRGGMSRWVSRELGMCTRGLTEGNLSFFLIQGIQWEQRSRETVEHINGGERRSGHWNN